jgi:hypothetical protein
MSRLREEAGMTLMEVLTACTVGLIVMGAMFAMLDTTVRLNTGVMSKTDAMQRGRVAMDVITQELRSQVCLNNLNNPAIKQGAKPDSVTFYSDFSSADGDVAPQRRTLTFDPDTGDVRTAIYKATKLKPGPDDFVPTPSSVNLRLENTAQQVDPLDPSKKIPYLRYFAYETVGNPPHPEPTLELFPNASTGLNAAESARVARIEIAFVSRPTGAKDSSKGVNLSDQIVARHSDPNLSVPDPKCV